MKRAEVVLPNGHGKKQGKQPPEVEVSERSALKYMRRCWPAFVPDGVTVADIARWAGPSRNPALVTFAQLYLDNDEETLTQIIEAENEEEVASDSEEEEIATVGGDALVPFAAAVARSPALGNRSPTKRQLPDALHEWQHMSEAQKFAMAKRLCADNDRLRAEATDAAMRASASSNVVVSMENDARRMGGILRSYQAGAQPDAPVHSDTAHFEDAVDPVDMVLKVMLVRADAERLKAHMIEYAAETRSNREALATVLGLPVEDDSTGTNDFERSSFFRAFVNNHLDLDYHGAVRCRPIVANHLWALCVYPPMKKEVLLKEITADSISPNFGTTDRIWPPPPNPRKAQLKPPDGHFSCDESKQSTDDARVRTTALTPLLERSGLGPGLPAASAHTQPVQQPPRGLSPSLMRTPGAVCQLNGDALKVRPVAVGAGPSVADDEYEGDGADALMAELFGEDEAEEEAAPAAPSPLTFSAAPVQPPPPSPVVRAPMEQVTMRANDGGACEDGCDETCTECSRKGWLFECDGCDKPFHFWCVRDQPPTAGAWFCKPCAEEKQWKPPAPTHREAACSICHTRKPENHFGKFLPACSAQCSEDPEKRVCTMCMGKRLDQCEDYHQVSCFYCKTKKTHIEWSWGERFDLMHPADRQNDWVDASERPRPQREELPPSPEMLEIAEYYERRAEYNTQFAAYAKEGRAARAARRSRSKGD